MAWERLNAKDNKQSKGNGSDPHGDIDALQNKCGTISGANEDI